MSIEISRRHFVGVAASAAPLLTRFLPGAPVTQLASTLANAASSVHERASTMDNDLMEIGVPGLHALYDARKYTVSQVVHWYLNRIARYNPVYRAFIHVDTSGALATAAAHDAAGKAPAFKRPALWGVPIVIKSNTSVKGLVTSAGFYGYLVPGLELIAPVDALVVAKLRSAGAVILGQSNMPDFAASDTNFSTAYGRTGNAFNVRYSPGGSSGGTVTAVTANLCVLGTGTDTANSIRMPAATSALVGVLPTRGLVSIAGINPLDWLRDNTGPIARSVRDTAIALDVMRGEDPKDFRTKGSAAQAQSGPYTKYLDSKALDGKRFGVPAFMMDGPSAVVAAGARGTPLQPETREMFMKAVEALRAAGATVVIDDAILPASFSDLMRGVNTRPYVGEGTENFLRDFGPAAYHSTAEYAQAVGVQLPASVRGVTDVAGGAGRAADGTAQPVSAPRMIENDPAAEETFWKPQRAALAAHDETMQRFKLDGFVYPAIQMPPNDEFIGLPDGIRSSGPHSNTGWVNVIGVPAVAVPAGFYDNGLPFGLELSAPRWRDGDLLGWAYAFEQATKTRKPPVLVESVKRK